jgi:type II secretory pathway component PulJ
MEMVVVTAIFSLIFIISYSLLEDAVKTSLYLEEHNDLPVYGQQIVNAIQRELLQTRIVFEATPTSNGPGYFSALTFPAQYPILASSQMPVLNPTGTLIPDGSTRFTGNCLLIARQLQPATITLTDGTTKLVVDRYVFETFYLTKRTTGQNFGATGYWIDAIMAKSDIYADYTQLTQWVSLVQTDANKTKVAGDLAAYKDPITGVKAPATKAWSSGQPAASAFYTINSSLGFTAVVASPTIPLTSAASLAKGLGGGRVSGKMDYSIGFRPTSPCSNCSAVPCANCNGVQGPRFNLPTDVTLTDGTVRVWDPIPKYANFNSSGLEFLMVGPAGSRRILSRVVIMASYAKRIDSKEALVITSGSS